MVSELNQYKTMLDDFTVSSCEQDGDCWTVTGMNAIGQKRREEFLSVPIEPGTVWTAESDCYQGRSWRGIAERLFEVLAGQTSEAVFQPHYAVTDDPPSPEATSAVLQTAGPLATWIGSELSDYGSGVLDGDIRAQWGVEPSAPFSGLYVHGDSYTGKTTSTYLWARMLLAGMAYRRAIELCGGKRTERRDIQVHAFYGVEVLSAMEFANRATAAAKASSMGEFIDGLTAPSVLILEDLDADKCSFSTSLKTALFWTVKQRIEAGQFTVITSNVRASETADLMGDGANDALLNRWRRHYIPVSFRRACEDGRGGAIEGEVV